MYGLLERDIKYIIDAVRQYPEIVEVVIFGSRAMGNYKRGSDVDLAIKGRDVDENIIRRLRDELEEKYPLPYFFDVILYQDISNLELKKHIDTLGKSIYKK